MTGVQTCALPISGPGLGHAAGAGAQGLGLIRVDDSSDDPAATRREEPRRIGRGGGLGARPAQSRGGTAGAGAWARGRRGRAVAQPHPRGLRRRLRRRLAGLRLF